VDKSGLKRVTVLDRHTFALGKWWTSFLYDVRREECDPKFSATTRR